MRPKKWRRAAVRRYQSRRLRNVLMAVAAAEATVMALGGDPGTPVRLFSSWTETKEETSAELGESEERFGIRFRLEDGTLWFYRERTEILPEAGGEKE